ncbi:MULTISPECIES: hypothetical protein [unclassified Streptomyces]|uniref:hypothetical protein n=1 Tax=unclassified Streptomyces TaxID=2593676 RepID=UPI001F1B6671|nr:MULTISPECIES: hypothetical protein [unclassified Streptomyces]MCF0087146.1 hypothetical protein [Streptomyces sp. MH192]MCF0099016.1 hypothetical protein [Streptomyces sp. MH191]
MTQQNPSVPEGTLIEPANPGDLPVAVRVAQEMLAAYGATDYADHAAVAQAFGATRESLRILLRAIGAKADEGRQARDLRALLEAVADALTLPYTAPNHDRRIVDRAGRALTVLRGALDEDPADIPWNTDYLRSDLAAEERTAAKAGERR